MNEEIEAIVFDAGGVLIYINEFRDSILKRVLLSKGYSNEKVDSALLAAKLFDREYFSQNIIVSWEDEKQWLLKRANILSSSITTSSTLADQLYHLAFDTFQYRLYEDSIAVLDSLVGKYRLFILSNASASLDWSFDYLGIRQYFDDIVISSYERCEKPSLKIFERSICRFNIDPRRSLFIDDKVENVIAAKECGLQGLHLQRSLGDTLLLLPQYLGLK